MKKCPENRKNEAKIAPPTVPLPEALYDSSPKIVLRFRFRTDMNWADDLSHSCPHRYFTPKCAFAFAFVILKVINSEIILFRFALISVSMVSSVTRKEKSTRPPPKENHLENFPGFKERVSRPMVDTKALQKPGKPYLPPKSFPLRPPFISEKKSSSLEQGGVRFLFPNVMTIPVTVVRGSHHRNRSEFATKLQINSAGKPHFHKLSFLSRGILTATRK